MQFSYEILPTPEGPAFLRRGSKATLAATDSIVFDCDGVLIDTRNSYDSAITFTADYLIRRMFNVELPWRSVSQSLIQGLRNTGMFNNDWDTVYAITLFVSSSLPSAYQANLSNGERETRARPMKMPASKARGVFKGASSLLGILEEAPAKGGDLSAAEAVWKVLPADSLGLSRRVREFLGYPGNPPASLLASFFDEVYHGGALYRKMYGLKPRYHSGPGLIERDRLIARPRDLAPLAAASNGRLAIATGRPRQAAEYSLGRLLSYFRLDASVFIGDGDIKPSPEAAAFRKPSGKSLLWAESRFHSKGLLYIGDSAEDLQMVKNARESADGLAFAGVYKTSYDPAKQLQFFKGEGAELILPSVRGMTRVMREVAAS